MNVCDGVKEKLKKKKKKRLFLIATVHGIISVLDSICRTEFTRIQISRHFMYLAVGHGNQLIQVVSL